MQRDVPRGAIFWWSGSIASIPSTYRLCDGTRGTPDLRNSFRAGSGDIYSVNETGGALTHLHPFTGDGHQHTIGGGISITSGVNFGLPPDSTIIGGTTDPKNSLPPFHALALVMYDGRPI